jgi:hypothetical protein
VLVAHFDLDFDARSMAVELHAWHPNDDLPYRVHTGKELTLMLTGTKGRVAVPPGCFYRTSNRNDFLGTFIDQLIELPISRDRGTRRPPRT